MSPTLLIALIFGAVLLASNASTYFYAANHTENRIKAEQADQRELAKAVIEDARKAIGKEVADRIAKIKPVYRTVQQETIREIRENPVYLNPDCAVPVAGVVRLNAARDGADVRAGPRLDDAGASGTGLRPDEAAFTGRSRPR